MSPGTKRFIGVGAWIAVAASGLGAWADDDVAPSEERVRQLEERLEASSRRLDELSRLTQNSNQAELDRQRVEIMKKQIREVLSEQEFRNSLMPSTLQAGYDKGFYIKSSDENFSMKFNGRMQMRWTHYGTRSDNRYRAPRFERDDRTGFDMQRIRFAITGNVYNKDLTYALVLRGDSSVNYDAQVYYAYTNYRFADEFNVMAGLFKIAATRQQMTSSANLQFVDRPMTDAVFQLDRAIGLRFWGQTLDKRLDYFIDVVNSFNGPANTTITNDPAQMDNNPGLVAHIIWHALGDNPGHGPHDMMSKDFSEQADNEIHQSPALDIGFHYAFNEDDGDRRTTRIPFPLTGWNPGRGGYGLTTTNGLQINQFGFDTAFKFMGFSATGEYIIRVVDPRAAGGTRPWSPWFVLTGDDSTVAQQGAYVQVGYFLPIEGLEKKLEAVARVGGISALAGEQEGSWEYAMGVNYYIEGNKVKLQTDVTKIYEVPISSASHSLANVNDDALIFRVQLQVAF